MVTAAVQTSHMRRVATPRSTVPTSAVHQSAALTTIPGTDPEKMLRWSATVRVSTQHTAMPTRPATSRTMALGRTAGRRSCDDPDRCRPPVLARFG